jgi:hypothetical protein
MAIENLTEREDGAFVFKDNRTILDKITGVLFNWHMRKVITFDGVMGTEKKPIFKVDFKEWNQHYTCIMPYTWVLWIGHDVLKNGPKFSPEGWHLQLGTKNSIIIPRRFAEKFRDQFIYMSKMAILNEVLTHFDSEKEPSKETLH